jgi:hypothetical protein
MFKITRIRICDTDGNILKVRHCDILTGNLELTRSELRRQYADEYGKQVKICLTYREGESDELDDNEE